MFKHRQSLIVLVVFLSLLLVATGMAATEPAAIPAAPVKQLAAPPVDILAGNLSLPQPAQNGVRSSSAMLPIDLTPAPAEQSTWFGEVAVASSSVSLVLFAPDSEDWQLTVRPPAAAAASFAMADALPVTVGIEEARYPGHRLNFAGHSPGKWGFEIVAPDSGGANASAGYLIVSSDSRYQLYTHLSTYSLLAGHEIGLVTYAFDADTAVAAGAPAPLAGAIVDATMQVSAPDGQILTLPMYDDGLHADGAAGDGVFGATFIAEATGDYSAQVSATGIDRAANAEFMRTSEHVFPVLEPAFSLNNDGVTAAAVDDTRLRLKLRGTALAEELSAVTAFAEVWGTNAAEELVPVAWIGGVTTPARQGNSLALPLSLDGRWIALAEAQAPFELRNVRVHDLDTHVPLAHIERLDLRMRSLPDAALEHVTAVTDEMLMGPAPEAAVVAPEADGRVVMLIHGYCSGANTWPTGHFSSYAVFSDLNQNRTHDQFAQLLRNYGYNFDSFGAIAHSQGGAASLHLYTYYWSGLDYSSGSRLIQSVGTPYRGTALAGNLAALGSIFGVGCGTNWDLTYDGAGLWLSGIPSWARSRVYYHTTSFTDKWWRYDYCNFATDLFLSDPDDGVIEKWAGQLSGANNMGHKTGWCHTTDMRDPGQTQDYNRNANMNAYANR